MLRLALASPLLLAACAAAQVPVHGVTPGHKCRLAGTGHFVGQAATSELGEAIVRETQAAVLRWAPPGVMLTMDYREDRVTVRLGPDHKVTAVACG
jgi:hypothetical protein